MLDYYYWPKELAYQVEQHHKIRFTLDRIRAIRRQSEADRDGTFIDGRATVSGLMLWLKEHPGFTEKPASVRKRPAPVVAVM